MDFSQTLIQKANLLKADLEFKQFEKIKSKEVLKLNDIDKLQKMELFKNKKSIKIGVASDGSDQIIKKKN